MEGGHAPSTRDKLARAINGHFASSRTQGLHARGTRIKCAMTIRFLRFEPDLSLMHRHAKFMLRVLSWPQNELGSVWVRFGHLGNVYYVYSVAALMVIRLHSFVSRRVRQIHRERERGDSTTIEEERRSNITRRTPLPKKFGLPRRRCTNHTSHTSAARP